MDFKFKEGVSRGVARLFRREQEAERKKQSVECGLCQKIFKATTKFHRFCVSCKKTSELFRFHESLPSGSEA
jgi:hypothetical protein